jgi:uncharacterized protein YraI
MKLKKDSSSLSCARFWILKQHPQPTTGNITFIVFKSQFKISCIKTLKWIFHSANTKNIWVHMYLLQNLRQSYRTVNMVILAVNISNYCQGIANKRNQHHALWKEKWKVRTKEWCCDEKTATCDWQIAHTDSHSDR